MNIKKFRNEKGLTQHQLAKNLGYSEQSVARWENGISEPSLEQLIALSKYFQISIDELIKKDNSGSKDELLFFENKDKSYFGYISIQSSVFNKHYPISYQTVEDLTGRLYHNTSNENNWVPFSTLNNRAVAFNINNIDSIIFNDDDGDQPFKSYEINPLDEVHSEEFYSFLGAEEKDSHAAPTKDIQEEINTFFDKTNYDSSQIYELLNNSYIYNKDEIVFGKPVIIYDEALYKIHDVTLRYLNESDGFLYFNNEDGSEYYLNLLNLSLVDSPLLRLKNGMKTYKSDIFKNWNERQSPYYLSDNGRLTKDRRSKVSYRRRNSLVMSPAN